MRNLTGIPRVTLTVDGEMLAADEIQCLGHVRVCEKLSRPALCELRFFATQSLAPPTVRFELGTALRVSLPDRNQDLFDGEVTAVEMFCEASRGRELRVRAFDRLHRLRKRQPVRTHRSVTLADLARELTAADDIAVEAEPAGPLWDALVQFRQTDFDLLADLAASCGMHFFLRDGVLRFTTLAGCGEPLPLVLGESLLEAHVERNSAPACRSVNVRGWDPWLAGGRIGRASTARACRSVSGKEPLDRMACSGQWSLLDEAVQRDAQAETMAQAELDHRVAAQAVLEGVADGDPDLRAGAIVDVRGVDAALDGHYVLTEVAHCIDGTRGFVSEISSRPPEPVHRPWSAVASFGVVTGVDDPDGHGRVKVVLPAYDDIESDWLSVVCPGAGPEKGLAALPDVDDCVLVLFPREDPAQGVVIGGLYGANMPPQGVVDDGAVRAFAMRSAGGQLVRLDDAKQIVRIENCDGSYVELSPGKVSLHAAADLDIAAPGHAVTIRGKSIDFRSA